MTRIFSLLLLVSLVTACKVKWVADYDAQLADDIVEVARHVDIYYAELMRSCEDSTFVKGLLVYRGQDREAYFKEQYMFIGNEIYGLYLRNLSRPLNDNSTEIIRSIKQDLWEKYEGDLHSRPVILKLHRDRFARNFEALLRSEEAKNIEDGGP